MKQPIFILLTALIAACAPTIGEQFNVDNSIIVSRKDDFQNTQSIRLDTNIIWPCSRGRVVEFNGMRFTGSNGVASHWIVFEYRGNGWYFFDSGQSMTLLIDGRRITMNSPSGVRPIREVGYGGSVYEQVMYEATPDLYREIIAAKEVRFQVRGSRGSIECTLSDNGKNAFSKLLAALK